MSSPRSPVTGRACLTFRLVSLRRTRRRKEEVSSEREDGGGREEEKQKQTMIKRTNSKNERIRASTPETRTQVVNSNKETNPSSSAVSMYTRLSGSLLESNRRSA